MVSAAARAGTVRRDAGRRGSVRRGVQSALCSVRRAAACSTQAEQRIKYNDPVLRDNELAISTALIPCRLPPATARRRAELRLVITYFYASTTTIILRQREEEEEEVERGKFESPLNDASLSPPARS
ncbi:unnamed protein product, partial [Brenthis ino]